MWKAVWYTSIILLGYCVAGASARQIYKWQDETGRWHFSQTPPAEANADRVPGTKNPPRNQDHSSARRHTGSGTSDKLEIINPALKLDGDKLNVTGTIENTSGEIRTGLEVHANIFGEKGNLIASARGDVNPNNLLPGRIGSFGFVVRSKGVYRVTLVPRSDGSIAGREAFLDVDRTTREKISGIVARAEKTPRVSILRSELENAQRHEVYFVGKVYNSGNAVAKTVKILFTILNPQGVKVANGKVEIQELSPGAESSFRERVHYIRDAKGLSYETQLEVSQ